VSEYVLDRLDPPTITLVRLAAAIAAGDEPAVRSAFATAATGVPSIWTEELVLQSYLFSGFPRALNAAREWRRLAPPPAADAIPSMDAVDATPATNGANGEDGGDYSRTEAWRKRGEATCAAVYDGMYVKLRQNVRQLHPALDAWMVVEGYGKVLGRPGLDLPRRELCIVAACAASMQDRQLHSHLRGALNVGVSPDALRATVDALAPDLGAKRARSVHLLLARVIGK
jgi:4-carboxymuconolactone decarboxylase